MNIKSNAAPYDKKDSSILFLPSLGTNCPSCLASHTLPVDGGWANRWVDMEDTFHAASYIRTE